MKPDPGPLATPEQADRAWREVIALMDQLRDLNLPYAAEHVRAHRPSEEAIAAFPWFARELLKAEQRAERSKNASGQRKLRKPAVTADSIERQMDEYYRAEGKKHGSQKAAAAALGASPKLVRERLKGKKPAA